jgi:hypothetical protein
MADRELFGLLERLREKSGANLGQCKQALTAAAGNPRAALNALAAAGFAGGRPSFDESAPIRCYELESYSQRLVAACVPALDSYLRNVEQVITAILLQGSVDIPIVHVSAHTGDKKAESDAQVLLGVSVDQGAIPTALGAEDLAINTFRYRFGLQETRPDVGLFDETPSVSWQEGFMPETLYCYEMLQAAQAIAAGLRQAGHRMADDCEGGYARHELLITDAEDQLRLVQKRLRLDLDSTEAVEGLARLCYATPEKQQWLVGLRK